MGSLRRRILFFILVGSSGLLCQSSQAVETLLTKVLPKHTTDSMFNVLRSGSLYKFFFSIDDLIKDALESPLQKLRNLDASQSLEFIYLFFLFYICVLIFHFGVKKRLSFTKKPLAPASALLLIIVFGCLGGITFDITTDLFSSTDWNLTTQSFITYAFFAFSYSLGILYCTPPSPDTKTKGMMLGVQRLTRLHNFSLYIACPIILLCGAISYYMQSYHLLTRFTELFISSLLFLYLFLASYYSLSTMHISLKRKGAFIALFTVSTISFFGLFYVFIFNVPHNSWHGASAWFYLLIPVFLLPYFQMVANGIVQKEKKQQQKNFVYPLTAILPLIPIVMWTLFAVTLFLMLYLILLSNPFQDAFAWQRSFILLLFERLISICLIIIIARKLTNFIHSHSRHIFSSQGPELAKIHEGHKMFALLSLINNLFPIILWSITFYLVIALLGFDLAYATTLFALLLAALVFIGKSFLNDVLAGIIFSFQGILQQGQMIQINSGAAVEALLIGRVEKVNFQCVSIRDAVGNMHTINYSEISHITHFNTEYAKITLNVPPLTQLQSLLNSISLAERDYNSQNSNSQLKKIEILHIYPKDGHIYITLRLHTAPLAQWTTRETFLRSLEKSCENQQIRISIEPLGTCES